MAGGAPGAGHWRPGVGTGDPVPGGTRGSRGGPRYPRVGLGIQGQTAGLPSPFSPTSPPLPAAWPHLDPPLFTTNKEVYGSRPAHTCLSSASQRCLFCTDKPHSSSLRPHSTVSPVRQRNAQQRRRLSHPTLPRYQRCRVVRAQTYEEAFLLVQTHVKFTWQCPINIAQGIQGSREPRAQSP